MPDSKRQIAYKVRIKDLLDGEFVKVEEEWSPNYIFSHGMKISRVNIIAAVLSKQIDPELSYQSAAVDDGSGSIIVRSFEKGMFDNLDVGDIVILIGRPREYGNEKYIAPEIIKKLNNKKWIKVRKLELGDEVKEVKTAVNEPEQKEDEQFITDSQKLINYVRRNDSGSGADIDLVIKNSKIENTAELIKKLISQGELFETTPGKIKPLE